MPARSKLTPEREAAILDAARDGASYAACAAAAGVAASTLHDWRRRGAEAKSGLYRAFVDALAMAEAAGEARAAKALSGGFLLPTIETRESVKGDTIERVTIERPPDARLALEWLARRCPDRWSPNQNMTIRHATIREALAAIDAHKLPASELATLERILDILEPSL